MTLEDGLYLSRHPLSDKRYATLLKWYWCGLPGIRVEEAWAVARGAVMYPWGNR